MLPMTILSMDVAMVSRYTAPVESSQTILLVLILEILDVILPTAGMSVGVLPSGHAGFDIFVLVTVLMKPWVCVEDCLTTSVLVGGNPSMEGAPGKRVDG